MRRTSQSELWLEVQKVVEQNPEFRLKQTQIRGEEQTVFDTDLTNLRDLLDRARQFADRDCLVMKNVRWTFEQTWQQSVQGAEFLRTEYGIKKGDRVALAMSNRPEWVAAFMAIVCAGAIAVPLNAWWAGDELSFALKDSATKLLIVDQERWRRIAEQPRSEDLSVLVLENALCPADQVWFNTGPIGSTAILSSPKISPDDDFCVMYTSGSTGRPKGVVLTHRGAITTLLSWGVLGAALQNILQEEVVPTQNPAILMGVPLFHVAGLHSNILNSMLLGRKTVMMRKWDALEAVQLIQSEQITNMVCVPTMSRELAHAAKALDITLDSLKDVNSGGAKMPLKNIQDLESSLPAVSISSGYAMTETNALGAFNFGDDYKEKPDSTGRAVPPLMRIEIWSEDGNSLPVGEVGEVCLKSPANFREYLNLQETTEETLVNGWVKTGDLGYLDEDGFLYIVDRKKDIIIRGGENISTLEVEAALFQNEMVADVAVIGLPDDRLGEVVGAAIMLKEGSSTTELDLRRAVENTLAKFKVPERFLILSEPIPRTGSEKHDKPAIRRMFAERVDT